MADDIDISGISDPKALAVIAKLLQKIAALEERIAQLERDSSTSSKPPSSDIVKPPREQRWKGTRNAGGQKGHKGVRHQMLPVEEVDRVERIEVDRCPECGGAVTPTGRVIRQQVYELVEKPVLVTEYRRSKCYCEHCQKTVCGVLPEGVRAGQQYGERLQAFLVYMKGAIGASYTELYELCRDVFCIKAARSGICNVVMRGSEGLARYHRKMAISARNSTRLNIDETSWKKNGKFRWAWVFCNKELAYFSIERSRGAKAIKKWLGKKTNVAVTSDFLHSYGGIPRERHQYCLAHLIRDLKFMAIHPDRAVKKRAQGFVRFFRSIFSMLHNGDPPEKIRIVIKKLNNYLARTKSTNKKFKILLRRLHRDWDCLWRFLDRPDLFDPTNNHAERTIRHLVRLRKVSQGSRTKGGELWVARFCSLFQTSKLQAISPWASLCNELARS
jgi:transposase